MTIRASFIATTYHKSIITHNFYNLPVVDIFILRIYYVVIDYFLTLAKNIGSIDVFLPKNKPGREK